MIHDVYVLKRPGVDEFLRRMGELYEVVIFTASLSKYADAVIDTLDKHLVVSSRLFRESCSYFEGNYLKVIKFQIFVYQHIIGFIQNW